MPAIDHTPWSHRLTGRVAAFWMVVLALGLAVIGIVIALQQARSLAVRLMAPAEAQAHHIAETALKRFDKQLLAAVSAVASHVQTDAERPWTPPAVFPTWVDGLFSWNGQELGVIAPSSRRTEESRAFAEVRLAQWLQRPTGQTTPRVEILYDSAEPEPVALACLRSTDPDGQPMAVAARIDLQRLRLDLVEPLLSTDSGLELVRSHAGVSFLPWSQRLLSAMRFWEIRPTKAFIREQQRTVLGQTLVHVGLAVLALITLLAAMWILAHVVQRDMALAKMKANFVADVSHELKTPLSLIRLFGETLQSGRVTSEEKRQEYYEIITRESTRLSNLINNILDFARIEAGHREYALEPTDIAQVVRETYEVYRTQLEHSGFEHHLTAAASLPTVEADRDAIAQALINLIQNAIKYSGEDRYLAIDVSEDVRRGRRGVLISVHDRGIGIRPEDRAHLFDGFFRAADSRVREQGGTGLGLALVKHIVDGHGGLLDVESRLVKGSTFRIFLPAAEHKEGGAGGPSVAGAEDSGVD